MQPSHAELEQKVCGNLLGNGLDEERVNIHFSAVYSELWLVTCRMLCVLLL